MRRHGLVRGRQSGHPAGLVQGLQQHPPGALGHHRDRLRIHHRSLLAVTIRPVGAGALGLGLGGSEGFPDASEHVPEDPQQSFGLGPVLLTQFFKPVPCLAGDDGHALAEHGHHLIPGAGAGGMHQAGQQRQPLVLAHPGQFTGVQHRGFTGEMADLRERQPGQPVLRRAETIQPCQPGHMLLQPAHRRPWRQPGQLRQRTLPAGRVHDQQFQQPCPVGGISRPATRRWNPPLTSARSVPAMRSRVE